MNLWIPLIASGVVLMGTLVATFKVFLPAAMRKGWGILQERFPAVPAAAGSKLSGFESVTVGGLRLRAGCGIQTDAAYLHLHPGRMARWAGCRAMSIPWDQVTPLEVFGQGLHQVEIAGIRALIPAWCLGSKAA